MSIEIIQKIDDYLWPRQKLESGYCPRDYTPSTPLPWIPAKAKWGEQWGMMENKYRNEPNMVGGVLPRICELPVINGNDDRDFYLLSRREDQQGRQIPDSERVANAYAISRACNFFLYLSELMYVRPEYLLHELWWFARYSKKKIAKLPEDKTMHSVPWYENVRQSIMKSIVIGVQHDQAFQGW
jgi:hypothetical protein